VELFLQVKDLFLQIYYVPGTQLWKLYLVRRNAELAAQKGLPNAEPPFFDHRASICGHLLQQPGRNQPFICRRKRYHEGVQRGRIIWAQVSFENTDEEFCIRDVRKDVAPILFPKKVCAAISL